MNTGVIILAAGSSSRLGQPKQLLPYKGNTLLNRVIKEAFSFVGEAVTVVTGYNSQKIEDSIINKNILICHNSNWEEGMAGSISMGLRQLLLVYPELQNCIIAVCDQPYLEAGIFEALYTTKSEQGKGIVAAGYSGTVGTPALLTQPYFSALLSLSGQQGARYLIQHHTHDLAIYKFDKGSVDIDTIEDYNKLVSI